VYSGPPGVARVPAGRYAPMRDTGARCGRVHATPGVAVGLAVRSADSLNRSGLHLAEAVCHLHHAASGSARRQGGASRQLLLASVPPCQSLALLQSCNVLQLACRFVGGKAARPHGREARARLQSRFPNGGRRSPHRAIQNRPQGNGTRRTPTTGANANSVSY
jgi:hypothetical protein